MYNINDKYNLKQYIVNIAGVNYYNESLRILRIEFNERVYDFKYLGGYEVPNPKEHVAVIVTSEDHLDGIGIEEDKLNKLPGINVDDTISELPMGFAYTVNKKQTVSTTNPNSGGAGFTVNNTNMFDLEKVLVAISSPSYKHYTNPDKDVDSERHNNVGFFINNDGTILLKSRGSSITMGEEGIYIAGNVSWEHSEHQREWMMDNPIQRFIPSTIPTGAVSIPELPNISKFANIANAAKKVRDVISKIGKVTELIS